MQDIIDWFRANPDVFGFFVASIIFIITILLVIFRKIQFWVTLVLLLFSLISGLAIANQNKFFQSIKSNDEPADISSSSNPTLPSP